MTEEEKEVQIAVGTYLQTIWGIRNKLYMEAEKTYNKRSTKEAGQYNAGTVKLLVEKEKQCADADLLYINAVIEIYGRRAVINWGTGEVI